MHQGMGKIHTHVPSIITMATRQNNKTHWTQEWFISVSYHVQDMYMCHRNQSVTTKIYNKYSIPMKQIVNNREMANKARENVS